MKNYILLSLLTLIVIINSCKEDVEIDMPDTKGILCLNGYLYADCDTNMLMVTLTGVSKPQNVKNAIVKTYVNGQLTQEKTESDSLQGGYYILSTKFQPGDVVRIEAEYNNQTAYREATVPPYPKDFDATVTLEKNKSYYDDDYEEYRHQDMYCINVIFNDISSDKNYYRLNTKIDAYGIEYEAIRKTIADTVYIDGDPYYGYRDTIFCDTVIVKGYEQHTYIGEAAPLTDEEMSADNDFMDGLYNYYYVFNNSRFTGGQCNIKVYKSIGYESHYNYYSVYDEEISKLAPKYYYTQYVGVETVDEQAYYYLKALNGIESGSFSNQELTGSVKMWRNVTGGSGNITFAAQRIKKFVIFNGEKTY